MREHPSRNMGSSQDTIQAEKLSKNAVLLSKIDKAARLPQSENKIAFQIVAVQLRAWVVDQNDVVCRPYYIACLELYPRGKVINQRLHEPASEVPSAGAMLEFLVDHMLEPPTGERRQRPTHVSFTDQALVDICSSALEKMRIEGGHLSLADGVSDYVKMFSDKMVKMDRASRGDASERPGILSAPGIQADKVTALMKSSVEMYKAAPWKRLLESIALEATMPALGGKGSQRLKYYVSVLGSDGKATGFAVMASLATLRAKYIRAVSGVPGGLHSSGGDDSNGTADGSSVSSGGKRSVGELLCAGCGCRVGEQTERDGARYVYRCGGCKRLLYCDEDCQRRDWALRHREECAQAAADPEYAFRREEWAWLQRELALLFVDPTSIPFDDLDAAAEHKWPCIDTAAPPLYPIAFVTIDNAVAAARRFDRPTPEELYVLSLLADALTQCAAPPPGDGEMHLPNGVALRVAEDLAATVGKSHLSNPA